MRRYLVLGLVVVLGLLCQSAAAAYPDPQKVHTYYDSRCFSQYDKRFVHDYVGAVGAEWGHEIEGAACELYSKTSAHFVLLTVRDTDGEDLESYALHLFETWGIGTKDRNDGILLLYVQDYTVGGGGGVVRVEVGYGLEGVVNARVSREAIDTMVDAKAQATEAGESQAYAVAYALASGSHLLLTTLDTSYVDGAFPEPDPNAGDPTLEFWLIVGVVIVLILVSLASSAGSKRRPGWGYRHNPGAWNHGLGGAFGGSMARGGMGGGGFRGGGGGGGFGGGRSGGGGGRGRL